MVDHDRLYRQLFLVRRFEETVLENFSKGVFSGTTHTYLGQEANAVGILSDIRPDDIVFSNHRCHGHFLAYGGGPYPLFAELMGKASGVCGGRGGSQHLQWRNFYSNGVQGGILPIATGMALAEKYKQTGAVAIVFLGDGTLGEGVVYEALNMAALWKAPVFYVLENNRIAQTTSIQQALAGDILARFHAFGVDADQIETSDVTAIQAVAQPVLEKIRESSIPHALVIHTQRFGPHSKGDDTRPVELIQQLRENHDPLKIHADRVPVSLRSRIEQEIEQLILESYQRALRDPLPDLWSLNPEITDEIA